MSDRFMNGVYTEFSIGLSNMWIGHLICRADYNPDQYLWEEDFTLAGRNTKDRTLRQMYYFKFAAKESKRPHLAVQSLCGFTFPGGHSSTLCCKLPWKQISIYSMLCCILACINAEKRNIEKSNRTELCFPKFQKFPSQPHGSIAMHDAAGWISVMDHLQQLCGQP